MSNTLASRRGPGPVGQFQTLPVKTILRFLTIPYICAQRILHLARDVQVFHMTSTHIARQALHLVILLNDSVDAEKGPNEEQQDERIDLGDDLIELEAAMKQWGPKTDTEDAYNARIPDIKQQYAQFFKRRFYFHNPRDPDSDSVFQKLLAYDSKTTKPRYSSQSISYRDSAETQARVESPAHIGEEPNVPVFTSNQALYQQDSAQITLGVSGNQPSQATDPFNSKDLAATRIAASFRSDSPVARAKSTPAGRQRPTDKTIEKIGQNVTANATHFPSNFPFIPGQPPRIAPEASEGESRQHRRKYEEIERRYQCGWNGCAKAYGTLNHLNDHVSLQGHGVKRRGSEFS